MTANNEQGTNELRSRFRLQLIVVLSITALLVFVTTVDVLGRLLIDPSFHVDSFFFGGLLTSLLVASGLATTTGVKLPGGYEFRKMPPSIGSITMEPKDKRD